MATLFMSSLLTWVYDRIFLSPAKGLGETYNQADRCVRLVTEVMSIQ